MYTKTVKVYTRDTSGSSLSFEQVCATQHVVNDAVAQHLVKQYAQHTSQWADLEAAEYARKAEFARVDKTVVGCFATSEYVLLKRLPDSQAGGGKRLKLMAVSGDGRDQGECFGPGGCGYRVEAGVIETENGATLSRRQPFSLRDMVSHTAENRMVPRPMGMRGDQSANALNLRHHLVTLMQVFSNDRITDAAMQQLHDRTVDNPHHSLQLESKRKAEYDRTMQLAMAACVMPYKNEHTPRWAVKPFNLPAAALVFENIDEYSTRDTYENVEYIAIKNSDEWKFCRCKKKKGRREGTFEPVCEFVNGKIAHASEDATAAFYEMPDVLYDNTDVTHETPFSIVSFEEINDVMQDNPSLVLYSAKNHLIKRTKVGTWTEADNTQFITVRAFTALTWQTENTVEKNFSNDVGSNDSAMMSRMVHEPSMLLAQRSAVNSAGIIPPELVDTMSQCISQLETWPEKIQTSSPLNSKETYTLRAAPADDVQFLLANQNPITIEFATAVNSESFEWICGGAATTALGAVDVASAFMQSSLAKHINSGSLPQDGNVKDWMVASGTARKTRYYVKEQAGTWREMDTDETSDFTVFLELQGPDEEHTLEDYLYPKTTVNLPVQEFTETTWTPDTGANTFKLGHTKDGHLQAYLLVGGLFVPIWHVPEEYKLVKLTEEQTKVLSDIAKKTPTSLTATYSITTMKVGDDNHTFYHWTG